MIKKKDIIFIIMLLITISIVNADDCYFKTYNNDNCTRISTVTNIFQITGLDTSSDSFDRVEVEVYNINNPTNKLNFEVDNNFNINQIMPFLEVAVYQIKVKAYDKAGKVKIKEFNYIFDNIEPMPPLIPIELNTLQSSINVQGNSIGSSSVLAYLNGVEFSETPEQNGDFIITLDNLQTGINYVKFYSVKSNGLQSQMLERIIIKGNIVEDTTSIVNSVSIDNSLSQPLNERTIAGITTKRNFYIQGTLSSNIAGIPVYINGIKTLSDQNGKFAIFVLLNQGDNSITATINNHEDTYNIRYEKLNFNFLNMNLDKIRTTQNVQITGKTNIDYPFLVFLNGNLQFTEISNNGNFDFSINGLNPGKNFIELRGIDNQIIKKILYYDNQNPVVEILSTEYIANNKKLIFKIKDDVGIELNSVKLQVNTIELVAEKLTVKGDIYIFDISDLDDGNYPWSLSLNDMVGNIISTNGNIDIDKTNTVIDEIYLDSIGEVIGNNIYLKTGQQILKLNPSRNIAFKSITLDGIEQTNYETYRNNEVDLELNIENPVGEIKFNFINNDYVEFTQTYKYFTDIKDPVLNLDYIDKFASIDKVLITGEINDDFFDWSTLKFNEQTSISIYGKYFEALIDVTGSKSQNLVISGNDFALNDFNEVFGSILYNDDTESNIQLDSGDYIIENSSIRGSIHNNDESYGVYNFVSSYDGFDFNKVYLSGDSFDLPLAQRYGIRSLNLEGFESSSKSFISNLEIDIKNPYYVPSSDGGNPDDNILSDGSNPKIFFSGVDTIVNSESLKISGSIQSSAEISTVIINIGTCEFEDYSFICDVPLNIGDNQIQVTVTDINGKTGSNTIIIKRVESIELNSLDLDIIDIIGEGIIDANGEKYLILSVFDIEARLNREAIIKVLIDGQSQLEQLKNGTFIINMDIYNELSGIESKEVNIQLKAQDEFGNIAFSNRVVLIYERVVEAFAKILVR